LGSNRDYRCLDYALDLGDNALGEVEEGGMNIKESKYATDADEFSTRPYCTFGVYVVAQHPILEKKFIEYYADTADDLKRGYMFVDCTKEEDLLKSTIKMLRERLKNISI